MEQKYIFVSTIGCKKKVASSCKSSVLLYFQYLRWSTSMCYCVSVPLFWSVASYYFTVLSDCTRALNLLVLLLPAENRSLLIALLTFLSHLVANQDTNKMSAHNVAMIIAPSLFPPRYVIIISPSWNPHFGWSTLRKRLSLQLVMFRPILCKEPLT